MRLIISAGAVLSICLLAALALLFPKRILTVDSGAVTADAMVILGGGAPERPERATELFGQKAAPLIIVSGIGDGLVNQQLLKKLGVPENAIIVEERSISTFENAKFSIPILRQRGVKSVIIVTSWYHSRRALKTFEHLAPDLIFYSRPAYLGHLSNDAQVVRDHMRAEYSKLLGYWLRYGVCPFC